MGNEHWLQFPLKEVVIYRKGKKSATTSTNKFIDSVPLIDIEAMDKGIIRYYVDAKSSVICNENDILVVWDGARFGLSGHNQKGAVGSTIMCLTPSGVDSTYLYRFITSKYQYIQNQPKGMAIPHVNPEVFWSLSVPIPPPIVQQQIVEKLDAILPKIWKLKERLEKIPDLLKKIRQSILSAACTGKLTEDWREGKDLPVWSHQLLEDVTSFSQGIQVDLDQQHKECNEDRIRFLRIIDFTQGVTQPRYVKTPEQKYIVGVDDVSIVRYGASTGFVSTGLHGCIANNLFRVIPHKILDKRYLYYFLLSPLFQNEVQLSMKGAAMPAISFKLIKDIPFSIPPILEQQEVVMRVDKMFALADSLEAKYKRAMQSIEKIEQSVLAKAFQGELVGHDSI